MTCARIPDRWMIGLAIAAAAAPASAKIGPIALADLARGSDHVVMARVASMTEDGSHQAWARLEIIETWKGAPAASLEVLASPTWTCDVSTAEPGETALFFLYDMRTAGRCSIAHAGRGRMPMSADRAWARAWTVDVVMPQDVETRPIPGQDAVGDAWVDATAMERIVREAARAPSPRDVRGAVLICGVLGLVAALSVRHALARRRVDPPPPASPRESTRSSG
jgi:hypothetical protein